MPREKQTGRISKPLICYFVTDFAGRETKSRRIVRPKMCATRCLSMRSLEANRGFIRSGLHLAVPAADTAIHQFFRVGMFAGGMQAFGAGGYPRLRAEHLAMGFIVWRARRTDPGTVTMGAGYPLFLFLYRFFLDRYRRRSRYRFFCR